MTARENASRQPGKGHCSGCRFNCSVERLQCGRGEMLAAKGAAEGLPPDHDYKPRLPAEARLAHVLPLAAERLAREVPRTDEQRIAGMLHRHGGFMSLRMLAAQSQLGAERHGAALASLVEEGLVAVQDTDLCGVSAVLTDSGERRARQWRDAYDERCTGFAAPLLPDERQQLVSLLFKLLNG